MRGALLLALATIAGVAEAHPAKPLAGRVAGTPRQCIIPDMSVTPHMLSGGRILYYRGTTAFVGQLRDGCPELTTGRRFITTSTGGQICQNDPVRIVDANGGSGFGFCTFQDFTPYTKAK